MLKLLTAFVAFLAAPLGASEALPAPTVIDSGSDRHDRLTVPVTIDGHGPFRFIVDTGADRTVVSRELADTLRLAPGKPATMHSMTGVGRVETVLLDRLGVGGSTQPRINAPALLQLHLGAQGLLGVDSLAGRRVVMDFAKQTFSVADSRTRERYDPDTIVVTARSKYGQLLLVDTDIAGVAVTVIVDSGAQSTIGNNALRAMLAKRRKKMAFTTTELIDVTGGRMAADVGVIDTVRIGGFTMNSVAVAFADAHPFVRFGLIERPAMLLGMDTLRAFRRVSLDFASRKVRFLLPDEA